MADSCLMYTIYIYMNKKDYIGIKKQRQLKIVDADKILSQLHPKNLNTAPQQILPSQ